jgi:hypothetical protein
MDSSWIDSVNYDTHSSTVTMNLKDGNAYDYADVPASTVRDWESSDSPGGFHNSRIRGNFDAVKR